MKKKLLIILLILVAILISTYIFITFQEKNITTLQTQVNYLEEEIIPMAFEITENKNSEIKVKTVFYNLDGDKIGAENLKLKGDELHIDFKVIDFSENNFMFFPYGLYSDIIAPADSIKVFKAYDKKGFPEIYDGITDIPDEQGNILNKESKDKIIKDLTDKFTYIKSGNNDLSGDSHGVSLHEIKSVSQFKTGFVYQVICHPHTGAVEITLK